MQDAYMVTSPEGGVRVDGYDEARDIAVRLAPKHVGSVIEIWRVHATFMHPRTDIVADEPRGRVPDRIPEIMDVVPEPSDA